MQTDLESMPEIQVFGEDGNALFGEIMCPNCDHPSLYHNEMPRWSDIHDDDMNCLRPVSILFCCSVCQSRFGLRVTTHKCSTTLSWQELPHLDVGLEESSDA